MEDINLEITTKEVAEKGFNNIPYNIVDEDISKVTEIAVSNISIEIGRQFAESFRKNIIKELRSIHISKKTPFSQLGSLPIQISEKVSDIKTRRTKDGPFQYFFTIDHDLAYGFDQGTGIYNPEDPKPIVPKSGKYMFIPSDDVSRGTVFKAKAKIFGYSNKSDIRMQRINKYRESYNRNRQGEED